jgi:hypothetical protein
LIVMRLFVFLCVLFIIQPVAVGQSENVQGLLRREMRDFQPLENDLEEPKRGAAIEKT